MRLVNFWASFQTVMIKKKVLRTIMKHTGPKKLQMRPSSMDSQQLEWIKQTCDCCVFPYVTLLEKTEACVIHLCHTSGRHAHMLQHLLSVGAISLWSNTDGYNDDNKRYPITSEV